MNIAQKTYLALDTSYDNAMVVLFNEEKILFERHLPERNAHSRHLCVAIDDALKQTMGLDAVLVGLGPGSFVGTRIALATALGFTLGRNLPLMGFCSHLALAYSLDVTQEKLALVMKASGELSYATLFAQKNRQWTMLSAPAVLSPVEIAQKIQPNFLQAGNRPSAELAINGPTAAGVYWAAIARLAKDGIVDESDFIKPNYVKAPSVSLPPQNKLSLIFGSVKSFVVPHASVAKSFFEGR